LLNSRRLVTAAWVVGALALGAYTVRFSIGRTTHGFIAYYSAARLLATGQLGPSVYEDAWFRRYVQEITGTPVLEIFGPNTPAMALLAVPVAFLGPTSARTVWLIASLVAYLAAAAALVRQTAGSDTRLHAGLVALLLLSPAVFANLRTGQAYLFVFAAFAFAALALIRQQDLLAGALIGLALVLKSRGAPLLLLLVAARRLRAAAAAAIVFAAAAAATLILAGAEVWLRYPIYVWQFVRRGSASVTAYQTTAGLFRRLCVPDPVWNPSAALNCESLAVAAPTVLIAGATAITIWLAMRARPDSWIAAGLCLSLLAVPIAEEHHFVLLGIPIAFALRKHATHAAQNLPWWPWLLFVGLVLVPLDYTAHRFTAGWSILAAYPRLYATWLLWALTAREMLTSRSDSPALVDAPRETGVTSLGG
jgi:Glycosyltransferase family 87